MHCIRSIMASCSLHINNAHSNKFKGFFVRFLHLIDKNLIKSYTLSTFYDGSYLCCGVTNACTEY